jgi:predicted Zn-dependent protease
MCLSPHPQSIRFRTTKDIPDKLVSAAKLGIETAITAIPDWPDRIHLVEPTTTRDSDDLISNLKNKKKGRQSCWGFQLDVAAVAERLSQWDVLLCNDDLMDQQYGWVFGVTEPQVHVSVLSVARFMNPRLTNSQTVMAVTRLLAHEVGHLLGLVERSHETVDLYGKHCANICVMRQAVTPLRWIKLAAEEELLGSGFCPSCKHELGQRWPCLPDGT